MFAASRNAQSFLCPLQQIRFVVPRERTALNFLGPIKKNREPDWTLGDRPLGEPGWDFREPGLTLVTRLDTRGTLLGPPGTRLDPRGPDWTLGIQTDPRGTR